MRGEPYANGAKDAKGDQGTADHETQDHGTTDHGTTDRTTEDRGRILLRRGFGGQAANVEVRGFVSLVPPRGAGGEWCNLSLWVRGSGPYTHSCGV